MPTDQEIQIYQSHVQSADKIDERRDLATRTYGLVCTGIISASVLCFINTYYPGSLILSVTLFLIAMGWRHTLISLGAKLKAKNIILTRNIENQCDFSVKFLVEERKELEKLGISTLEETIRRVILGFMGLSVISAIVSMALICATYF